MKRLLCCIGAICTAEALLWLLLQYMQKVGGQLFVLLLAGIFLIVAAAMFVLADFKSKCDNIGYLITYMRSTLLVGSAFCAVNLLLWYGLLRRYAEGGFWLGITLAMVIASVIIVYAYGAALTMLNREEKNE